MEMLKKKRNLMEGHLTGMVSGAWTLDFRVVSLGSTLGVDMT